MKGKFTVCWWGIVLILVLTGCNTSSDTTEEERPAQEATPTIKEEPKKVETVEEVTPPPEDWSAAKARDVIENNYRLLSEILTVHQTEYFKKADFNASFKDIIDMEQLKEELSVLGTPEWLDSGDVEFWMEAYVCECDAFGNLRPYPLDMRLQIENQVESFITISSIDLQNEMGYGGGTWNITLDKKDGKFHAITYKQAEEFPLNLTAEEVIDYYHSVFQTNLTFIEETVMEGSTFYVFKSEHSYYAINPLTSTQDWQVASLYNEPTSMEEESDHNFTEHGVIPAESIALDLNDPSTFIGTWMDSTDYSGVVSSLTISKLDDVYEINLLEHSPGAFHINGTDGEVTFTDGKASFEFLEDANGNSGRIDIELTIEGVIYRKTMATNYAGWFSQDSEVWLGLRVVE